MLSQLHRFHGYGSLRYVYKNGKAVRSHLITLKYSKHPYRKNSRFAVVVSKKVHKGAVGRNRMRRRMYEIVRLELPHLTPGYDIVFILSSSEILSLSSQDLRVGVKQLLEQADLYK